MTAIFYPDCRATSPSGLLLLEANSPHNGTIPHRDGRSAEGEFGFEYREHQSDFRYRLIDTSNGRVLWERWQSEDEDSPHEVLVSDCGWSVLRTHGFRPELIAVSPSGDDVIRVKITDDGSERSLTPLGERATIWSLKHLEWSTAGLYWAENSWPYFFQCNGRPHFAWLTCWGQRAVIDLTKATLISETDQAVPAVLSAMTEEEKAGAQRLLSELFPRMAEILSLLTGPRSEADENPPLGPRLMRVVAAIRLVGLYRLNNCLDYLRGWEEVDYPSYSTGCTAMPKWWLEVQYFRPIVQHALRLLDQEPAGWAAYHFLKNDRQRFPVPERVPDRYERLRGITPKVRCEELLRLIGAPDHITRCSRKAGIIYVWPETWEYDSRVGGKWMTTTITWEERGLGLRASRITSIETMPSDWLVTDRRILQIHGIV